MVCLSPPLSVLSCLPVLHLLSESLKKWKESLGVGKAPIPAGGDARKVIVHALAMEVVGRGDVSIDLSTPGNIVVSLLNPSPSPKNVVSLL